MWGGVFGQTEFQAKADVSDETLDLYRKWFDLLKRWNSKINLVGSGTLDNFWLRHALDSHQVYCLLPENTKTVIDLGAGAGFPGVALAILMRDRPDARITMVESNGKKCNFLRTVIRELSLPAEAVQKRAEDVAPKPFDVVTARAFAPLPRLFFYAQSFWHEDTVGVFPKGESWESEIDQAESDWEFSYTTKTSQTDELARLVKVVGLQKRQNHVGESVD